MFLTTHYLDEADALADRIVIIDQGRIVASDTADNLKAQVTGDLVDLEVAAETRSPSPPSGSAPSPSRSRPTAATCPGRVPAPAAPYPGCCGTWRPAGVTLESIEVHRPTLDDVFLTLTGRSLRDAEAGPETPRTTYRLPTQDLEGAAR